jgi:Dolichyl-phosphate-mannose-protein mannosyltransferase
VSSVERATVGLPNSSGRLRSRIAVAASLPHRLSLPGLLYAVLIAAALASIVAFLVVAGFRLSYPYPLQVTEQPVFREMVGILRGQPLYVAPTLQHIPLIYGPVYFYVSAGVALLTGASLLPLRLVSCVASIGSLVLVGRLVQRETGSLGAGVVAAGLLAATYPLADTALDLGRVDALFVFLLLAGLYVSRLETLRVRPRWVVLLGSGCLIGLAGMTKLPTAAAPIALALFLYLLVTVRARALAFVVGCIVPVMAIALVLRVQSGPWPTWYFWNLPSMHEVRENFLNRLWYTDLLPRFTLPLLLGPAFVIGRWLRHDRGPALFYGLASLGLIGLAWASRSNPGGSTNVLLPAHALMAILLGLGLNETLRQIGDTSARAIAFRAYVLGLCCVQFALIAYNPRPLVPYRSDQWADDRLAARLASLPGEIFAPDLDGYLVGSANAEQPHLAALGELEGFYGGRMTPEGVRWHAELDAALKEHRFSYVVVGEAEGDCCLKKSLLDNGYLDAGPLFGPDDDFFRWKTPTGHTPEEHVYAAPGE